MDFYNLTSPCGLDCFNCPLYLAGQNETLRASLAARLKVPVSAARCRGCRNQSGQIEAIGRFNTCHIFRCARARGQDFCGHCPDFPCDLLHPLADQADQRPHNTKVFNSCLIKKLGLEKWALEKAHKVKETYFNGRIDLSD